MGKANRARQARSKLDAPAVAPRPGGREEWYLTQANRGEELLLGGQLAQAADTFAAILARLGTEPGYERAVILERLGRCLHMQGRSDGLGHIREAMAIAERLPPGNGATALCGVLHADRGEMLCAAGRYPEARTAFEQALTIAEELRDLRAQGVDLGQLGALALQEGNAAEALSRYRAALGMFAQVRDPDMEAVVRHQLGRILHAQHQWDEAERQLREAARIRETRGHPAAAAQSWDQLAAVEAKAGRLEAAEASYRKATAQLRRVGDDRLLGQQLATLADFLQQYTDRVVEARQLAEEALLAVQKVDPADPRAWQIYGLLADLHDREAGRAADEQHRSALRTRAKDFRRVHRKAPPIVAALARLGAEAPYERAMLFGRLGRCFHLGRRSDLALAHLCEAAQVAERLPPDEDVRALLASVHTDLAEVLSATGQHDAARGAHDAALFHSAAPRETAAPAPTGDTEPRGGGAPGDNFAVTLHEALDTDCVFEPDLLLDGRHEQRTLHWAEEAEPLADHVRPMLAPWTRTCMDEQGAVRFLLHPGEPALERRSACVLMRRTRREVAISGQADVLWRLVRAIDGTRRVADLLHTFAADERGVAGRLLAALAATDVVDVSDRPVGRWMHSVTKKGVLPGGGLAGDEVLRLATDGGYRGYPGAPRFAVAQSTPDRLHAFHALTRLRRSRRDYSGQAVSRADFDALLHTACGVTGALSWMGQETKLHAYPASGALYAVEIYPAVLRVEGLAAAIYHYRADDSALELVRPDIDPRGLISAALPVEREMVAGAAALICLTGFFPRHEKKYGAGGYRMMVAEAGHISQNLILAATALGLSARPFGGVFDELLNRELGLKGAEEQFLLAVLVGHSRAGSPP